MTSKIVMLRLRSGRCWLWKAAVILSAAFILAGCASHSPIIREQTQPTLTTLASVLPNPTPTSTEIASSPPAEKTTEPPGSTTVPVTSPPILTRTAPALRGDLLTQLCWSAYSPTHFDPTQRPIRYPNEDDVRQDLQVLHNAGFTGLVTYSANYEISGLPGQMIDIPKLAQEAGFDGMIMGVWDPTNALEMKAAEMAGQSPIIIGYSVGNEGLDERYDLKTLVIAMEALRFATNKPVTTTEQVGDYYRSSPLWKISDWIFPNAHPYFSNIRDPQEAVAWTEKYFENFSGFSDKIVLFKEVGLPSGGDVGLSEYNQANYYQLLRKTAVDYVVFEAFDAPWKHLGLPDANGNYPWPDPEPHWGIFTSMRTAKPAASGICSNR